MDELRITARRGEGGRYEFEVYDASDLFNRATRLLDRGACAQAVPLYDRLHREFAGSRYHSAALYNAGLCLIQLGELQAARARYETLLRELPGSRDARHASFQLVQVLLELESWQALLDRVDALLARDDLTVAERVEAMARRAQALFGARRLDEAERQARGTLALQRQRPEAEQRADVHFAAAANFVLAETIRSRAQALRFPKDSAEAQQRVLLQRAELVLKAQREYFNAIRFTDSHWAAASGYRIGHMYDELWHAIMHSPIPPRVPKGGEEAYRDELAKLIKPLIRHAIRYWELTLMLIERTGVQGGWASKTRKDLERVRELMLEQPPGPGGVSEQQLRGFQGRQRAVKPSAAAGSAGSSP